VLLVMMSGCAQLPVEEVRRYSGAFEQVRGVTETLIEDFDNARKEVNRQRVAVAAPRFPATFDPNTFLVAAKRSEDVAARYAALDAVSKYNQALVALADGRGIESAKAAVGSVLGSAAVFLPQIGVAAPIVSAVIVAVERARTQTEFVRAYREVTHPDPACAQSTPSAKPGVVVGGVANAAQCGPLIKAIFAILIADTTQYYDQHVTFALRRSDQIKQPGARTLSRSINTLTARYAPPAPGSPLASEYLTLAAEYQRITAQFDPTEPQSFRAGKETYDVDAQNELRGLIAGLREIGRQEQKIIDDLNTYHARLIDYVRLLEQTYAYLDAVGEALERPADVDALAGKVVELGSTLRRDGGDLRGAFLKLLVQ
jgi:hypothetical protein